METAALSSILVLVALVSPGDTPDRFTLENVTAPPEIHADEPLAEKFSLELAARSLDQTALHWQKSRKCGTCHTNFAYMIARPTLASVSEPAKEVRPFFEAMVEKRWEEKGPRWDAEVVCVATTLAVDDRLSGTLHPTTKKAFERMFKLQREDGSWEWLKCGWPPFESDDHYGATFAAIGLGALPTEFKKTPAAEKCLNRVREYLRTTPPPALHHKAMLVWASTTIDGILTDSKRRAILDELFALQHDDGGWSVAALVPKDHERKDDESQNLATSDGYATGFLLSVARKAGVPASDPRIEKGIRWLKTNQRASGRWFTRSPTKNDKNFLSNAGTAWAVMALAECGEVGR